MDISILVNQVVLVALFITALVFFLLWFLIWMKHKKSISLLKWYLAFVSVTYFVLALTAEIYLGISLSLYIHVLWIAANIQLLWLSAGETFNTVKAVKDLKDKITK